MSEELNEIVRKMELTTQKVEAMLLQTIEEVKSIKQISNWLEAYANRYGFLRAPEESQAGLIYRFLTYMDADKFVD